LRLFRPGLPGRPPARHLPSAHCTTEATAARRLHCLRLVSCIAAPGPTSLSRIRPSDIFPNHNMPKHTVQPAGPGQRCFQRLTPRASHIHYDLSCAAIAYHCIAAADSRMSPINKIKGIEQHTTGD
jgi:hypothetical protein